ncbi:hypothetical protein [Rhizobium sp.]|uniref:hypothetical protein n=1 Tax=Rhizobium sp. TaxID=391 RepID=UPI0028B146E7
MSDRGARSSVVNPEPPTTPDSIAVHHILDADVADPAFWKEFAADVLRPSGAWMRSPPSALVSTALMHAQLYRRRTMGLFLEVGAGGLGRSFPASNQMLRYQRMPEGLVHEIGLPAHRAMLDAYLIEHHLRDSVILGPTSGLERRTRAAAPRSRRPGPRKNLGADL